MSPAPMSTLYQRYKDDTDSIARWIHAVATKHGYQIPNPNKKKKEKAPKNQPRTPYRMRTSDFVPMSELIAQQTTVSVPLSLGGALARAIEGRVQFTKKLKKCGTADYGHSHFVNVLRRVREILQPLMSTDVDSAMATIESQAESLAGVQDSFGQGGSAGPSTMEDIEPDSAEPDGSYLIFDSWRDDFREALFVWETYNSSLQELRRRVEAIWQAYHQGRVKLAGAAVAHNIALLTVRSMESQIQPLFEHHGGFGIVISAMFDHDYVSIGRNGDEQRQRLATLNSRWQKDIHNQWKKDVYYDFVVQNMDIADRQMFFAYHCAMSEAAMQKHGTWTGYNGKWGEYDPGADRSSMSNQEKYNQDHAIVCEQMADLHLMTSFVLRNFNRGFFDELTKTVEHAATPLNKPFDIKKISLELIVATQFSLDSLHVLGSDAERACQELLAANKTILASAKALQRFFDEPKLKNAEFRAHLDKEIPSSVVNVAEIWHNRDWLGKLRHAKGNRQYESPDYPMHRVLKQSPSLSGWWLHILRYHWYHQGLATAGHAALPLYAARLYYALVQEKLLEPNSWRDMDAFCILQKDVLWNETYPKSGEYLENFQLDGGTRVGHGAPKIARIDYSAGVAAKIVDLAMSENTAMVNEKYIWELIEERSKVRWVNGEATLPCPQHGWKEDRTAHKVKESVSDSSKRDPLLELALAVDAEEIEQSFDYMTLYRVSWKLLSDLAEKGAPILHRVLQRMVPGGRSDIVGPAPNEVVYCIFKLLFPRRGGYLPEARDIVAIVEPVIKGMGDAVHKTTGRDWTALLRCTCGDGAEENREDCQT